MKLKLTFLFAFLTIFLFRIFSQQTFAWPEITKETKPWARWWWMGSAVNDSDLTYNMELYQKAGLGGLELTPIYGVKGYEKDFIDFLSPKWMDRFTYTLKEAQRLNMGIDLANATGWPFGGPWIPQSDVSKYITYKTYTLKGGEILKDTISFMQKQILRYTNRKVPVSEIMDPVATTPNLQEKALDQVRFAKPIPMVALFAYSDKNEMMDLTSMVSSAGKLNWTAPAGNWTLYALFQGPHGKLVERAAPGGEGEVIDHFSEVASRNYFNHFDGAFKNYDLSYLRGYFNDSYEVDDANGEANWTPQFFDSFYSLRGYDLKKYIPALFGQDTPETNARVLCDYRETISDLLLKNFTTEWHTWAQKQHKIIRNQAHGSPANILDLYAVVDIPEIEGRNILRLKFASSASHVLGKKLTSAESATWLNEHFLTTLGEVKEAMDRYLLGGINHNFYHGIDYSPKNDPWPGWLFYASVHFQPTNPFWTDFAKLNTYVTRCQSFLQQGKPDNDILLYFPIHESWSLPDRGLLRHFDGLEKGVDKNAPIHAVAEDLLKNGYAFDFISDHMLQSVKSKAGTLEAPGGTYKTLVFPAPHLIPIQTMVNILNLATNGATIIFYKTLPTDVPGLNQLKNRQDMLANYLKSIRFEEKDSIQVANYGSGKIILGDNLEKLLHLAGVENEKMYRDDMQCIRRKNGKETVYFITNGNKKSGAFWVPLSTKAKSVILYNPMSGIAGATLTKTENDTFKVLVQMQNSESVIVKLVNEELNAKAVTYPIYKETGNPITLENPWNVSFVSGGPNLPGNKTITRLESWTNLGNDTLNMFSGTACYKTMFTKPKEKADAYLLNLGKVCCTARIFINGAALDTVIGPNFQVTIPAKLLKSKNTLEIYVSNQMANRIAYMDKQGIPWKKFYNINFQTQRAENRNVEGIFTAEKWVPRESGLLGPVTLTILKNNIK